VIIIVSLYYLHLIFLYTALIYIKILVVNNRGILLLSQLINPKYPAITSVKKFMDSNNNKTLKNILEKDILASNIYTLGYENDSKANLDYTKKLIIT